MILTVINMQAIDIGSYKWYDLALLIVDWDTEINRSLILKLKHNIEFYLLFPNQPINTHPHVIFCSQYELRNKAYIKFICNILQKIEKSTFDSKVYKNEPNTRSWLKYIYWIIYIQTVPIECACIYRYIYIYTCVYLK